MFQMTDLPGLCPQLSVEAFEKREKRKEANRHAAKKSRDKRDQEFKSLKEVRMKQTVQYGS